MRGKFEFPLELITNQILLIANLGLMREDPHSELCVCQTQRGGDAKTFEKPFNNNVNIKKTLNSALRQTDTFEWEIATRLLVFVILFCCCCDFSHATRPFEVVRGNAELPINPRAPFTSSDDFLCRKMDYDSSSYSSSSPLERTSLFRFSIREYPAVYSKQLFDSCCILCRTTCVWILAVKSALWRRRRKLSTLCRGNSKVLLMRPYKFNGSLKLPAQFLILGRKAPFYGGRGGGVKQTHLHHHLRGIKTSRY